MCVYQSGGVQGRSCVLIPNNWNCDAFINPALQGPSTLPNGDKSRRSGNLAQLPSDLLSAPSHSTNRFYLISFLFIRDHITQITLPIAPTRHGERCNQAGLSPQCHLIDLLSTMTYLLLHFCNLAICSLAWACREIWSLLRLPARFLASFNVVPSSPMSFRASSISSFAFSICLNHYGC